ncbi:MAG: hypothetical protein EXR68_04375 [Dehalococcoidia bacterium]|nr:hypothetical protein [Dehalococcoidia bacterium]
MSPILSATLLAITMFASTLGVASAACNQKTQKGYQIPEAPYVAFLPVVTMAGVAGLYFIQRRRAASLVEAEADATE